MNLSDKIQAIHHYVSIADIISIYTNHNMPTKIPARMHCPLCDSERKHRQNFAIHSDQHWSCYRCNAGGDAISLVMKLLGIGFVEAVADIMSRTNMEHKNISLGNPTDGIIYNLDVVPRNGISAQWCNRMLACEMGQWEDLNAAIQHNRDEKLAQAKARHGVGLITEEILAMEIDIINAEADRKWSTLDAITIETIFNLHALINEAKKKQKKKDWGLA